MPFKIGGVGQDQIGIGDGFRRIGIGIDEMRDHVIAVLILVGQHIHGFGGVHGRVPGHVGHVHEQRVDLVGIAGMGIGDDHVHEAVGAHRVFPGVGFVDPRRAAVFFQAKIVGALDVPQMRAVERFAGGDAVMRFGMGRYRFRIGRLEAEAAGNFDRAKQDLQRVQGAGSLKAVRVRRNPAHRVERDRATLHGFVGFTAEIGPFAL